MKKWAQTSFRPWKVLAKKKSTVSWGAGRWQSMQSATNPWALLAWEEARQAVTAGRISWQEAQKPGVDVRTMVE